MDRIIDDLARDVDVLQDAGVDALLFVNENDVPYTQQVGLEVVAAAAAAIGRLRPVIRLPFGVDLLWDAKATLAVARATGAVFARDVFTGVFDGDMGLLNRDWGELAGYRHNIGAQDVAVFTYITAELARSVSGRTIAERADGAAFLGIDAVLVTAHHAGTAPDLADLRAAREGAAGVPVIAATGVTHLTAESLLTIADGVLAGSDVRVDGCIWNDVDPGRARRLVDAVAAARAR
jgi:membrane complex biogenesis BtpA family protein